MLSIEEKKALENMRIFARVHPDMAFVTAKEMDIVVTLVEKQQKEIEELKEKLKTFKIEDENIYLQFGEITEKKRWKDKIKAKIEELEKQDRESKMSHNYLVIPVLQSLLEKE